MNPNQKVSDEAGELCHALNDLSDTQKHIRACNMANDLRLRLIEIEQAKSKPATFSEQLMMSMRDLAIDRQPTLRDKFAMAALQTMQLTNSWSANPDYWIGVAKSAFICADAMLKARNQ